MREDAHPSKINQALFVREFVKLAEEKNWNYNIIEAFDQPWKRVSEGAVGGFGDYLIKIEMIKMFLQEMFQIFLTINI
jgi:exo-beta-1,3-glucanase (GH17 family)